MSHGFRLVWTPFAAQVAGRPQPVVGLCCPGETRGSVFLLTVGRRRIRLAAEDLPRWPGRCDGDAGAAVHLWPVAMTGGATRIRARWLPPRGRALAARPLRPSTQPCTLHLVRPWDPLVTTDTGGSARRRPATQRAWHRLLAELDAEHDLHSPGRPVWTVPAVSLLEALDDDRLPSADRRRLEQALKAGRIVPSLTPPGLRADLLGIEPLCRSQYAARELADRWGIAPAAAAVVPAGPAVCAALAMAVRAAGGRFLFIRPQAGAWRPDVPELFWWKLPDDRRLLCAWPRGEHLLWADQYPWQHRLVIADHPVLRQLHRLAPRFEPAGLHWSRLEAFADAVIRSHGDRLPVVDKELAAPAPDVPDLAAAGAVRRAIERACAAETLASLAALAWDGFPSRDAIGRAAAAHDLLVSAASGCRMPGVQQPPARLADAAAGLVEGLEAREALQLARRMITRRGHGTILVLNTLARPRGGLVRMWDRNLPEGPFELIDPNTGANLLYERRGGVIEFIAPQVPACGWLALEVRPVERRIEPGHAVDWNASHLTLHNEIYSLQFHQAGGLCRWHDRSMSCQWCSTEAPFPMGAVVADAPPRRRTAGARIVPLLSPLYSRIVVEAEGPAGAYRSIFTLYRDRPELYVRIERPARVAERNGRAHAFFGLLGESPFLLIDRVTHVIEPGQDLLGGGPPPPMAVSRGLRVEGSHAGMNFFSLDAPLIGFGRPAAAGATGKGSRHPDAAPRGRRMVVQTGQLYVALPARPAGPSVAEFVLQPTGNDAWDGRLALSGAEFCRPLVALALRGRPREPSASMLSISPSCVQLVTLKPAADGRGFVLRLWNADVDPVTAEIAFNAGLRPKRLAVCDALERPTGRQATVRRGSARLRLNGYEIATVRV